MLCLYYTCIRGGTDDGLNWEYYLFSFVEACFHFGRGAFSMKRSAGVDFNPRQFPLIGSIQNALMTHKACVFSFTDGLSCAPFLIGAKCQKNFSNGSCDSLSLRKTFTTVIEKMSFTRSTRSALWGEQNQLLIWNTSCLHVYNIIASLGWNLWSLGLKIKGFHGSHPTHLGCYV